VSGYYFAHPNSQYFGVAKINNEQVQDYAQRKNIAVEQAQKLLQQNLS
jgi:5-methyltetrahydrofolate--homocysteine methyltransferase